MRLSRTLSSCVTLALCGLAWSAGAAMADVYPSKPITLVVGYPPGGSTDLTGRALGLELSQRLGVPVVIENVGGAGGAIGAQKVANAAPDGYTLLVGANNEVAISRLVNPSVRYDLKDFTPIGLVASQPLVLVASPAAGVKNANDLLALLKKNPGKFSYGSSGVGTSLHLAGEMVKQQGGVFMTHVPYRGVAPLTNDLLGGNIEFGMFVLSSALPYIRSGKMVALGTTEAKRSAITPDVPALGESPTLKGLDISVWFALLGPARLPEPVQASLKKALADILQSPDFRKKMEASSSVVPTVPVDLDRFLVTETAKYKKIVQFANIKE
ncbi:Bug family tripartite tricarboxylate transporter substrate binding protein [Variovorax sp. N23]|uniref:Bug family tripartite tricarboxylate transporter substrate binding protein n=1 Tax=Variovorax sp. N23 TaxID=2980555 RepID=UPI0021C942EF|nr:tripartite tricarboxylate transporter substrate binding protein [Variovorax sp. N23]MCU4117950.1 tripartite tricarboxylate transporter substrate binding protein [Variovorax sp. N23]